MKIIGKVIRKQCEQKLREYQFAGSFAASFLSREAIVEIVFSEPFEALHILTWSWSCQGIITSRKQVPLKNFGGIIEAMGLESNTLIILLCEYADGTVQIKISLWSKSKNIWFSELHSSWFLFRMTETKNQNASGKVLMLTCF